MQNQRKTLRIGITLGDINGIGPELVIRSFAHPRLKEICTPIIYGSPRVLNIFRKMLDVEKFSYNVIQEPQQASPRKISVIDCMTDLNERIEVGRSTEQSGRAAYQALAAATQDLTSGEIDALVTMPIDKYATQGDEFQFPGHTEYLADAYGVKDSLMFMIHEHLKVGVVTGHVAVKDISKNITVDGIVKKVQMMQKSLKIDFGISHPKIAVLGLNPHAGDNGFLGKEELETINKAVEICSNKRILAVGPFSADGFFGTAMFKRFDAILAMYHDQGLIPFKLLAGFEGVNFTAGLPGIRTSPDHGPAFNLAGKGVASTQSAINAIYAAIDLYRNRVENEDLTANPLQMGQKKKKNSRHPQESDRDSERNSERNPARKAERNSERNSERDAERTPEPNPEESKAVEENQ